VSAAESDDKEQDEVDEEDELSDEQEEEGYEEDELSREEEEEGYEEDEHDAGSEMDEESRTFERIRSKYEKSSLTLP